MKGLSPLGTIIFLAICVVAFFWALLPMTAWVLVLLCPFCEINNATGNFALLIAAVLLIGAIIRGAMS